MNSPATHDIDRYHCWSVAPGCAVERMNEHAAGFAEDGMPKFRGA